MIGVLITLLSATTFGINHAMIRRGVITEDEFRKLVHVSQEMSRLPLHIDQTGGLSIAQLSARARKS